MKIMKVKTNPFYDQKPGTSGLRKKVSILENSDNYLENFIQSYLNILEKDTNLNKDKPIFIGGDGRYYNDIAIQKTIRILLANSYKNVYVAEKGICSTPAMSNLIRKNKAIFGVIFSASHNPAGKNGDFGIKINIHNGGPAPTEITDAIFEDAKTINYYNIIDDFRFDIERCTTYKINDSSIVIFDAVKDYVKLIEQLFDIKVIKDYLKEHSICFDAMNAVTGPYAKAIFSNLLGVKDIDIIRSKPLCDFGGIHPDPSPKTAKEIYEISQRNDCPYDLLIASDGDGDRNMILGRGIFVKPSDSLAIIADNSKYLPIYKEKPLKGVARSLPTSRALDLVAKEKKLRCYETPTGWKFFNNLLDSGMIELCGEESFGTSANHIREKDGIWAALCWLNIMAVKKQSVTEIVTSHWQKYGRYYQSRYDFENILTEIANEIMISLPFKDTSNLQFQNISHTHVGQFNYKDPTTNIYSNNEGFQVVFSNKARFVVRMSGTGTDGATIRLYLEVFDKNISKNIDEVIQPLADLAINFIKPNNIKFEPTNIV